MSEMIERVLKAIQQEDDPISDGSHTQRFSPPNARQDRQRRMARAAIEAMRTPTIEMMEDAVSEFTFQSGHWGPETTPETIQKAVFQRAIDAALSEKP